MSPRAIISYDDTPGDHDALMLGRILADAGADADAGVRAPLHAERAALGRRREEHEAETLLQRGADWFSGLAVDTRVDRQPLHRRRGSAGWPSTTKRTSSCSARTTGPRPDTSPRSTPRRPCSRAGPAAVAIAPAGYHAEWAPRIHRIGVLAIPGDDATIATARALADSFGATLTRDEHQVDLLVVGSRSEAPHGRVMISAQAQNEIENATCPVLVRAARRRRSTSRPCSRTPRSLGGHGRIRWLSPNSCHR